jgi:hypothetical protein
MHVTHVIVCLIFLQITGCGFSCAAALQFLLANTHHGVIMNSSKESSVVGVINFFRILANANVQIALQNIYNIVPTCQEASLSSGLQRVAAALLRSGYSANHVLRAC